MRNPRIILVLFFSLFVLVSYSQEKSRKQLREDKRSLRMKEVEKMMTDVRFNFIANYATTSKGSRVDLTTNSNFIRFTLEEVIGDMPFFGIAYSGVAYTNGSGIDFKGRPENVIIEKKKKNYIVTCKVDGNNDLFKLTYTISFGGSASVSISSNKRSNITYKGEILFIETE